MLTPRNPTEEDLNGWILKICNNFGIPWQRTSPNHWQLAMKNFTADYILNIIDQGEWVTYGIVLVHDVVGEEQNIFYGMLLDLSNKLNGTKIARQGDLLVLLKEEPKAGLNPISFSNHIILINSTHQFVLGQVLEWINKLGLKLIR